ncbi:uncharacterized protein KGF55_005164 [Candida pseudojiufengensis]|uniref:uncharacterized protein n=1 Tax=Candida pseudojiufengensis TaxID=497109 RepID=UPI002224DBBC|nr:uncharacterized protein KGF55_005164 [Candida pseudojiufengensis]KAI5959932.1 hypothetical protein KGF55_005164 [Candida pseudojiufengensis]
MVQYNYQAPWVPIFNNCVNGELTATDHKPPFTTFQLATIDKKSGYPKNRTLIYRGWLFNNKSSNVLIFTTDKRMEKYQELLLDDKIEAVFWFSHIRKQFRLRGVAKIIDNEHIPNIDLSHINGNNSTNNNDSSNKDSNIQNNSIQSSLLSPSHVDQKPQEDNQEQEDSHIDNVHNLIPPTNKEWEEELKRNWNDLSKTMKTSFRKPYPKSEMNDDNLKLISKIQRGVDGKKDDDGFKNFVVVGLFINYVDYFEQDKDKRFIYELNDELHWEEKEVCP